MKVAICTLGCKVNQYETQAMEAELLRRGHLLVPFEAPADAYIVNTCTVTAAGDHKSRQAVRQCKKRCPGAIVAVCGCYAQTRPEEAAALGVDLVGGCAGRMAFLDSLEQLERRRNSPAVITVGNIMSEKDFEELPAGGLAGRTRAMLKVEDGCVNFCSYCVIPYARGPVRSLPADRAAGQARRLVQAGYREVVLTGIELSSWGRDLGGRELIELLEAVCAAAPSCRVRLGSLEPRTITEEFCRRAAALNNLCGHFHLSLQSGSDSVLRRMNRKYDCARYYESVKLLRAFFDRPGITADLIVGFPGESDAEFAETLAFLDKCEFSSLHVFPYSRRAGTPAAAMPGQVPRGVKEERVRLASLAARRLRRRYLDSWVGGRLEVLFEEERDGLWRGHAGNYAEVRSAGEKLHNALRLVEITGAGEEYLAGTVTED